MAYILENEKLRLELCENTGAVLGLLNKETGWQVISQRALSRGLTLLVPIGPYESNRALPQNQMVTSAAQSNDEIVLRWAQIVTERAASLEIAVTVRWQLSPVGLRVSITVENKSPYQISEVWYPSIGGIKNPGADSYPKVCQINQVGSLTQASIGEYAVSNHGYWGTDVPTYMNAYCTENLSHSFELIQQRTEGLYIGTQPEVLLFEPCCMVNEFLPGYVDGKRNRISETDMTAGHPTGAVASVVRMVYLQPGETRELEPVAIQFYTGAPLQGVQCHEYSKQTAMNLPEWYGELDTVLSIKLTAFTPEKLIAAAADAAVRRISAVAIWDWHDEMFAPVWSGWAELLARIQKKSLRVLLFADFNKANTAHESCRFSIGYREVMESGVRAVIGQSADGLLYDSGCWPPFCLKTGHNHKPSVPVQQAYYETFSAMKQELESAGLVLGDVGSYQNSNYIAPLCITTGRNCGISENRVLPAGRVTEPHARICVNCTGAEDRNLINHAIAYGYAINQAPHLGQGGLESFPKTAAYAEKMTAFRRKMREYLWDAKIVDFAAVEGEGLRVRLEGKDDKSAVVFVNTGASEAVSFTLSPEECGFTLHMAEEGAGKLAGGQLQVSPSALAVLAK